MFEKRREMTQSTCKEESKSIVEHKKCHISEMREKRTKSDIGRSGSGKICAILHVHYMHGGPTCLSQKKRKTKVVS